MRPNYEEWDKDALIEECDRLRGVIDRNKAAFLSLQTACQRQREELEELKLESEGQSFIDDIMARGEAQKKKNMRKFGAALMRELKKNQGSKGEN